MTTTDPTASMGEPLSTDRIADPLTDEDLAVIRGSIERTDLFEQDTLPLAFTDRKRLLAEVDRLRGVLAAETARANERNEQFEQQAKRAAESEAARARVGVLEGQLATARKELDERQMLIDRLGDEHRQLREELDEMEQEFDDE